MKKNLKYGLLSGTILLFMQFIITKILSIQMPFFHQVLIYFILLVIFNGIVFWVLREKDIKKVKEYIAPFEDAIVNIHLGENNHIFIMKSFFRSQEEAISILKSKIPVKKTLRLQKAWDGYKDYYENNAKGRVFGQFAQIAEPHRTEKMDLLQKHLTSTIKEIKQIAQQIT